MQNIPERIRETILYIKTEFPGRPDVGIVLGSGLSNLVDEIDIEKEIDYHNIPYFPQSTVLGHSGKLIFGRLGGKTVVAMSGRFHFYEGYSAGDVAYPIRVLKALGIGALLISNAAGGLNPQFKVGDLMIIKDHISLLTVNPLLGKNYSELGPRFPDMSEPYAKELIRIGKTIAKEINIDVEEGVYVGVTGPTFETRAEYKMLHLLGADAVGMSTVQEVIVARHSDLPVFAMSVITDIGIREEENTITHDEVLQAAKDAEPRLTKIFKELVARL
ncbi:MAG: purine-nucleoside phosphorylase [Chitinophagaceae bacterium]